MASASSSAREGVLCTARDATGEVSLCDWASVERVMREDHGGAADDAPQWVTLAGMGLGGGEMEEMVEIAVEALRNAAMASKRFAPGDPVGEIPDVVIEDPGVQFVFAQKEKGDDDGDGGNGGNGEKEEGDEDGDGGNGGNDERPPLFPDMAERFAAMKERMAVFGNTGEATVNFLKPARVIAVHKLERKNKKRVSEPLEVLLAPKRGNVLAKLRGEGEGGSADAHEEAVDVAVCACLAHRLEAGEASTAYGFAMRASSMLRKRGDFLGVAALLTLSVPAVQVASLADGPTTGDIQYMRTLLGEAHEALGNFADAVEVYSEVILSAARTPYLTNPESWGGTWCGLPQALNNLGLAQKRAGVNKRYVLESYEAAERLLGSEDFSVLAQIIRSNIITLMGVNSEEGQNAIYATLGGRARVQHFIGRGGTNLAAIGASSDGIYAYNIKSGPNGPVLVSTDNGPPRLSRLSDEGWVPSRSQRGRGGRNAQPQAQGQSIAQEYAAQAAKEYHAPTVPCDVCGIVADLKMCSGCKRRRYCSPKCQKIDWTKGGHKKDCRAAMKASATKG